MENKNENSDASKTYEERQREARRRYYEKIKDTEEYKQKNISILPQNSTDI